MFDIDASNEPSSSEFPITGNYVLDSYFINFIVETSHIPKNQKLELLVREYNYDKSDYNISFLSYENVYF